MLRLRPPCTAVIALLAGCAAPDDTFGEGISVGNPTKGMEPTVVPGDDVASWSGTLEVGLVTLLGCDGEDDTVVAVDRVLPAAGGRVLLPPVRACGLEVELPTGLALQGVFVGGEAFEALVEPDAVTVDGDFTAGVGELLLQLGPAAWLTRDAFGAEAVLHPGDAGHDALAALLADGSLLVEDGDGDGERDDGEGVVAKGKKAKKAKKPKDGSNASERGTEASGTPSGLHGGPSGTAPGLGR